MTTMSGARALAEMLDGYGTTHVFMVPAVLRRSMAELERRTNVTVVHAHGEKAAAYMADGYARVSGRPGVCMAQQVGAANLAAGLRDACLAHAPVIAMTGGSRPQHRHRGLYQEADDLPAFAPYTKWNVAVDHVERFPDMIAQAYRVATSGCPGPVHLQFQGQEGEIDRDEADMAPRVDAVHRQVPPYRPAPGRAQCEALLALLQRAERPLIVAGGGVHHSGAAALLHRLAEALAVPVVTSLNGRGCLAETHPLCLGVVGTYSRPSANQALAQADAVLFIGTSAGSMVSNFWRLPRPATTVAQIDIEAANIGRTYPVALGMNADVRTALEAMLQLDVPPAPASRPEWLMATRELFDGWCARRMTMNDAAAVPIRPERLCAELTSGLPEDAVIVVDTGHAGMWMASMFELTSPTQRFIRSAGHLGWAFPAGLGAKCAAPGRPVVTFTGDLGLWYHIGEIETAVRLGINAVTVVNNNHSGNQSKRGFKLAYEGEPTEKSRELWVQREVNFAELASNIGALGIRVDEPDGIAPALEKALVSDRPVVIDVATDIDAAAPLAWDDESWVQRY
jgi:acetolactate synthase-1/2/3 large subunit